MRSTRTMLFGVLLITFGIGLAVAPFGRPIIPSLYFLFAFLRSIAFGIIVLGFIVGLVGYSQKD